MNTISVTELRAKLSPTLKRLQAHEFELLVIRDGMAVAKIVPASLREKREYVESQGLGPAEEVNVNPWGTDLVPTRKDGKA